MSSLLPVTPCTRTTTFFADVFASSQQNVDVPICFVISLKSLPISASGVCTVFITCSIAHLPASTWYTIAMKLSVIIPCKNEEGTVEHLLDSLARQSRPADEIIIVNSH